MARLSASRKRRGFRRTDLLVLLVLLTFGGGLLMASGSRLRESSDRARSSNNLKQLVLASIDYADHHMSRMPSGIGSFIPNNRLTPGSRTSYGPCLFHILPHLEQENLYLSTEITVGDARVRAAWEAAGKGVKVFIAPGDPTADAASDRTSYLANGLAFPPTGARFPASFLPDGPSNTIFFAEAYSRAADLFPGKDPTKVRTVDRRWWDDPTWTPMPISATFQVAPEPEAASVLLPQGFSSAGIQVGMGDGSVRMVSPKCRSASFYAGCTAGAGDILGDDF